MATIGRWARIASRTRWATYPDDGTSLSGDMRLGTCRYRREWYGNSSAQNRLRASGTPRPGSKSPAAGSAPGSSSRLDAPQLASSSATCLVARDPQRSVEGGANTTGDRHTVSTSNARTRRSKPPAKAGRRPASGRRSGTSTAKSRPERPQERDGRCAASAQRPSKPPRAFLPTGPVRTRTGGRTAPAAGTRSRPAGSSG